MIYDEPNSIRLGEIKDVFPKDNEVKIRVKSCGICGSDVHGYLGLTGRRIPPMVMGHEFSGEVVEIGGKVTRFKPGDRVAPYPVDYCGSCAMCQRGQFHLCSNKRQFGVLNINGAFAEYICVPEKVCFKIADSTSYDSAALIEPLSVAMHAVNIADGLEGKTVLIVGAGTIGLAVLACVKLWRPAKVYVSDISEARLKTALKMGADAIINPASLDFPAEKERIQASGGLEIAFEAVGATPTVQQAMSMLAFGGTAVWIGNNKPMIEVNMQEVVTHELKVKGSFLYTVNEFATVISCINEKKLCIDPIISLRAPLSQAAKLFETLAHNPGDLIKVIINP